MKKFINFNNCAVRRDLITKVALDLSGKHVYVVYKPSDVHSGVDSIHEQFDTVDAAKLAYVALLTELNEECRAS